MNNQIDTSELDKFIRTFTNHLDRKIIKGHLWTAITKNAKLGKKMISSATSFGSVGNALVRKGWLKSGFKRGASYVVFNSNNKALNRTKYINSNNVDVRTSIFNKRKFKKPRKSGFGYVNKKYIYADKFLYSLYGNPTNSIKAPLEKDYEIGVKKAIEDSFRKVFK